MVWFYSFNRPICQYDHQTPGTSRHLPRPSIETMLSETPGEEDCPLYLFVYIAFKNHIKQILQAKKMPLSD